MGVNKYASTFSMASCNEKTCNNRKKERSVKKYENTRVPTVREKSVKNEKSSRSGKSQGILS